MEQAGNTPLYTASCYQCTLRSCKTPVTFNTVVLIQGFVTKLGISKSSGGCTFIFGLISGIFGSGVSGPQATELLDKVLIYYGKGQEGSAYNSKPTLTLCNLLALK